MRGDGAAGLAHDHRVVDGREAVSFLKRIKDIIEDARKRMGKSVDSFRSDLARLRTGRAQPSLIEHIMVNYYGTPTPLPQCASVSVEDADALSESEQALLGEPGMPPPKEAWQRSKVVALFAKEASAQEAERSGAHGVLLLPHYLTEASQEGLVQHVEAVCKSVKIGVIVYNRGACRLQADTLVKLAERLDVTGRRIVVLSAPGDRRDVDIFDLLEQTIQQLESYIHS